MEANVPTVFQKDTRNNEDSVVPDKGIPISITSEFSEENLTPKKNDLIQDWENDVETIPRLQIVDENQKFT